jgi:hypothetical protein
MPQLNPLDDINTYLGIAARLQGKTNRPGQTPELNPAVLNTTPQGFAGPDMLAQSRPIEAALDAKTQGASRGTHRNADYLGQIMTRNYEGAAESLARTHGTDTVNAIIKVLPTLNPSQMNALAPLLQNALREDDRINALRMSGGPR